MGIDDLGSDVYQHQGFPLAAQARLHKVRQLGVSEGHVLVRLGLGRKHVSKSRKTPVDVASLSEPLALGT